MKSQHTGSSEQPTRKEVEKILKEEGDALFEKAKLPNEYRNEKAYIEYDPKRKNK